MRERVAFLKERSFELFEQGKETFWNFWNPLNPREKLILGSAASVFGVALLVVMTTQLFSLASYALSGPTITHREVRQIERIVEDLRDSQMEIRRFERLRASLPEDFNPETFLREEASRLGLSVRSLQPTQASTPLVGPDESYFELSLDQQSPLPAALRYLNTIEQTLGLRVITLELKPDASDRQQVEVTAKIAYRELP